jgi:uncharacterized protein (DUF2147 family)
MVIILITGIWLLFLRNAGISTDGLEGEWLRTDGPYTIEISDIGDDGKMTAKYYNPSPINVGRSGWRIKGDELQIFVDLQDENYPGSLYELVYDKENDKLTGTYYQAVTKQSYKVEFNRK